MTSGYAKRQLKVATSEEVEPSLSTERPMPEQNTRSRKKNIGPTSNEDIALESSEVLSDVGAEKEPSTPLLRRSSCTEKVTPNTDVPEVSTPPCGSCVSPALSEPRPPPPSQTTRSNRVPNLGIFSKNGILAGHVQVQWDTTQGARRMAADNGRISRKGLQVKMQEGRIVATTRGLARDVEVSAATILRVHDSYAMEGKATFEVVDDVGDGNKITSCVLLSKARPDQLAYLLEHLRQ